MSEEDKVLLKNKLNEALTLKNKLRDIAPNEQQATLEQIIEICALTKELSEKIDMQHGKALSIEMSTFAQIASLSNKHEEDPNAYEVFEAPLEEAKKIAKDYGDAKLENRILEIQANMYLRMGRHDKEAEAITRACGLQRTVPKVLALLDALSRLLDSLFLNPSPDSDLLMKVNADFWETYLILCEKMGYDKKLFIADKRRANHLFKVALYIGSFAGNPLHGGQEEENFKLGMEAFDEAIWVANQLDNKEYLCAATAHKASVLYHKLTPPEKKECLKNLKHMQEKYEPENTELIEIIENLTKASQSTQQQ
eukprot:TRINITY_DN4001_c0_g2_i1.p1 TRINITY_DN4001_c0_g2~~TRINITY_DN4001_c0_g2_i1.p1  ORF type:complete len:310 (-),score=78.03 TRINITY_DN4001_c0_g2_i1:69-998(-)